MQKLLFCMVWFLRGICKQCFSRLYVYIIFKLSNPQPICSQSHFPLSVPLVYPCFFSWHTFVLVKLPHYSLIYFFRRTELYQIKRNKKDMISWIVGWSCPCSIYFCFWQPTLHEQVWHIFNEPEDIFPSDIGEVTDFSQPTFPIDDNGGFVPAAELSRDGYVVYYCWWDWVSFF